MQVNFLNNLREPSRPGAMANSVDMKDDDSDHAFLAQMKQSIREASDSSADKDGVQSDAGRSAADARKVSSARRDTQKPFSKSSKCKQSSEESSPVTNRASDCEVSNATAPGQDSTQEEADADPTASLFLPAESPDANVAAASPNALPVNPAAGIILATASSDAPAAGSSTSQMNTAADLISANSPSLGQPSVTTAPDFVSNSCQTEVEKPAANVGTEELNASEVLITQNIPASNGKNAELEAVKSGKAPAVSGANTRSGSKIQKDLQNPAGSEVADAKLSQILNQGSSQKAEAQSESVAVPENSCTENISSMLQNAKPDAAAANSKTPERSAITGVEIIGEEALHATQEGSSAESSSFEALRSRINGMQTESTTAHSQASVRLQDATSQTAFSTVNLTESGISAESTPAQISATQSREFIHQVAERIQVQVRDGKGEIRIQLKPESLGRMEIKAESTASGVVAKITTESKEVRSYLENNMHVLQQSLQDQGLKVDRIQIVVQNGFDAPGSSGYNPQSGHAGSGNSGENAQNASQSAGSSIETQIEEGISDASSRAALNPNGRFHAVA